MKPVRRRYTYADYEQAKQAWLLRHPSATSREYEAAMVAIAKRLGL